MKFFEDKYTICSSSLISACNESDKKKGSSQEKPVHNWNINLTHEFARSVDDLRRGKQPRPIDCLPPKTGSKEKSKPTAQSWQIPKQD